MLSNRHRSSRTTRRAALAACARARFLVGMGCVLGLAGTPSARAQPLPGADLPPPPASSGDDLPNLPPASGDNPDTEPPPQTEAPPPSADLQLPSAPRTAMVVDAATRGIDPRVGQHVTLAMREAMTSLGYSVATDAETVAAAQRARMTYPPAPADLWRVTMSAGVDRTAFARVWADSGRYVFEVAVASADGSGPFFARGSSGAEDLHAVVTQLTRDAVPPPHTFDAAAAARYRAPTASASAVAAAPMASGPLVGQLAAPTPRPPVQSSRSVRPLTPAETRAADAPGRRFQLALYSVSAIGADGNGFYNHIVDLSLGVRVRRGIILSLQVGYTNLNGRNGREHNLLPMFVLEKRLRLGSHLDLSIPIKGAVGFLPFNGPVLRVSAGLAYAFGERVEITADLLSPSFWMVDDDFFVSMNVAVGLIVRL